MKHETIEKVFSPKLSPELLEESKRIAAMSDEDIDLTEMPEWTDFSNAVRGKFYRPVKKQVTLRVDADVLEWFKPVLSIVEGAKQGGKRGSQTAINAALRKVVEDEMKRAGRVWGGG